MDKAEFSGMLTKMGFDKGTIMLLQQGEAAVSDLVGEMRQLSYTQEDAEVTAKFNDSLQDLQKSLMGVASEIFKLVLPALSWLSDKAMELFKYLRKHPQAIKAFFIGLAAVIVAAVIPAFKAWFATLLASPITWLVLLLAGLALLIEDLLVWVDGGESAFGDFWASMLGSPDEARYMWKMFKEDLQALWEVVKNVWGALSLGFTEFADGVSLLKSDIGAVIDAVVAKAGEIADGFGVIKDDVGAVIDAVVAKVKEIADGFGVIKDDVSNLFSTLGGLAQQGADAIANAFKAGLEVIAGLIDKYIIGPINKALGLIDDAKNAVTGALTGGGKAEGDTSDKAAQREAAHQANMARAGVVGGRSSEAMSPPGDVNTTNNVDQSTSVGAVNVTVNQASPQETGEAYGAAIQNVGGKSARAMKQ
jgi:phage-related protein